MATNNSTIIIAEPTEELASLLDRAINAEGETVYLVLDEVDHISHNLLNLRLLKREGDMATKSFVVIAASDEVRRLAETAGMRSRASLAGIGPKKEPAVIMAAQPAFDGEPIMDIVAPDEDGAEDLDTLRQKAKTATAGKEEEKIAVNNYREEETRRTMGEIAPEPQSANEKSLGASFAPKETSPITTASRKSSLSLPKLAFPAFPGGFIKKFFRSPRRSVLVGGALVGAVALFFVGTSVLPHVTVAITPQTVEETVSLSLLADSNISSVQPAKNIVPAQIVEEREERDFTFEGTGEEEVEASATGVITVYNAYSSQPQPLVQSTRFVSSDGKLFRTVENIVIPGASIQGGQIVSSSAEVPIEAAEPGETYNIGPTEFSIPGFKGTDKYMAFYGKSTSSMEGGFVGIRTVVTEEDINNATEQIKNEMLAGIEGRLEEKIPESLMAIEDSLTTDMQTLEFDAKAGDAKDRFSARAIGRARILLVNEQDINTIITTTFNDTNKYDGAFEMTDNRASSYVVKEIDYENGTAKLTADVTQTFIRSVDTSALTEEISGKNDKEVRRILADKAEFDRVQVRFWPFWVSSVPTDTKSISIEIVTE